MKKPLEDGDPRRRILLRALAAGLLGGGLLTSSRFGRADLLGQVPSKLPPGRSIYSLQGEVLVDGKTADPTTLISPSSEVRTGDTGRVIFVLGSEAFLLRANSRMAFEVETPSLASRALRLFSGKLLSVFGRAQHRIETPLASIGIRGTSVYVEAEPELSYICTCYGETDIRSLDDPASTEAVVSKHHDAPRYVLAAGGPGKRIEAAPFKNHTDDELALIETLVGRVPPFSLPDGYGVPRKGY